MLATRRHFDSCCCEDCVLEAEPAFVPDTDAEFLPVHSLPPGGAGTGRSHLEVTEAGELVPYRRLEI